jgi:hypothetical protein
MKPYWVGLTRKTSSFDPGGIGREGERKGMKEGECLHTKTKTKSIDFIRIE